MIPAPQVILKHILQNFYGGQTAEHIQEWQKLTSDKVVLQMNVGDTTEFENDIPTKHNPKQSLFFSRGSGRIPS